MRLKISLILSFVSTFLLSQNIMTYDEFIKNVKTNHPVMYQAELLEDRANSNMKMAKGGFDPKVAADWNHKSFDNKNYFSYTSGVLKIPTWFGIDVEAGYNRNSGVFLNPTDNIPDRGLWNAGISVPLGKGLVLDQRRAELQKADVFRNVTTQEQNIIINELLYSAAKTYVEWQVSRAYLNIAAEGQILAKTRFEGVIKSFLNGDKPAIDTLESFISYQTRQIDYQKAQQDLQNAVLAINNFLWIEGEIPLELNDNTLPENINLSLYKIECDSLFLIQDQWLSQHPELLLYEYLLSNIDIERRLAKEEFKPDIRLSYNPLVGVGQDDLFDQFNTNNYKVGARFEYPIIQRKQRGKFELINIKKKDTEFKRSLKNQDLQVKLETYINNINQTQNQLLLLDKTVENYNRMLNAENTRLSVGESSIFLVNSRESKYLESNYKRIEAVRKVILNRLTYLLIAVQLRNVL